MAVNPLEEIFNDVRAVEAYAYHSRWLAESPEKYQAITRQRLLRNSADVQAPAYAQSRRQLELLRREINKTFAAADLLITPTRPLLPAKISDNVDAAGGFKYPLGIRNTAPFDVFGVPAISIPCGFTSGLPIGLQIAGPHSRNQRCWRWRTPTNRKRNGIGTVHQPFEPKSSSPETRN